MEKFVKEKGLEQKVLLEGGSVAREKYIVRAFPTDFLLDPEGTILKREVGFAPDFAAKREAALVEILEKHAKKESPGADS